MRIAVDAMGSDRAPYVEVHGSVVASMATGVEVVLVGDAAELKPTLAEYRKPHHVSVMHASEVVTMSDSPVKAVRQKKDSSLVVAIRLLKEGLVDGLVSAGNTGAVMVGARLTLGLIKGVSRCAICQCMPTEKNPVLLIDMGANVDCTAQHLCEFAEMGMVYMERAQGVLRPRVGLLNIGEERAKGSVVLKAVQKSLAEVEHINFIGNVEPKAMFQGAADVVVCDGFAGNLVLKTTEAVASLIAKELKRQLISTMVSKLGSVLSLGAFRRLKQSIDPNEYPGAPLLGVNGTVIICHGASSARGITNSIYGACRAVETGVNQHIREGVEKLHEMVELPEADADEAR